MWKRLDGKETTPPTEPKSEKSPTNTAQSKPEEKPGRARPLDAPHKVRRGPQIREIKKSKPYEPAKKDEFQLFVGNLSPDVDDAKLQQAFAAYGSLTKALVVQDKHRQTSKGYGFVAFSDSKDYLNAFRDMNSKYVGSKPVQLKRAK